MQHVAPPQYSPDGRWWWNGRAWTPVTWPVPTAGEAPDASAYVEERRQRTPRILWVGLIALVLLLVLAFGASAAAWVAQLGFRVGAPAVPAPVAPATPAPATAAPAQATPTTGGGSASDYRQVVSAGIGSFQSAGQMAADRCAAAGLSQGTADCRAALESLDGAVQRFQTDLEGTQVPPCMQPADRELRGALALYHKGIQQELEGIDGQDVSAVAQGASTLRDATNHAQSASSLLQASC